MGKLIPPVVVADAMGGTEQPTIEIDRELHLRPWDASDAGSVLEAFSDPDIQHWHFRRFETEAEAAEWIRTCNADWQSGRRASWAIIDTESARVVGRVAITTELEDGHGEVSYWVLPAHRAKGVATRACVAATRWAHVLGLHRIALQHSTRNDASRSVAVKAGFVEEGVRRGANLHDDGWHDMRLYSHLATDPTS